MIKQIKSLNEDFTNQSLSHATLKTEHLVKTFMSFLQSKKEELNISIQVDKIQEELNALPKNEDGDYTNEDSEYKASVILNEDIFDLLITISPQGTSFGCHQGDGSDFGFWEYENEDDEFEDDMNFSITD